MQRRGLIVGGIALLLAQREAAAADLAATIEAVKASVLPVGTYNPTDSPVVIDLDGHVLAGGEWGDVQDNDLTQAALSGDRLLPVDPNKEN